MHFQTVGRLAHVPGALAYTFGSWHLVSLLCDVPSKTGFLHGAYEVSACITYSYIPLTKNQDQVHSVGGDNTRAWKTTLIGSMNVL